jgi:hypothetical protein
VKLGSEARKRSWETRLKSEDGREAWVSKRQEVKLGSEAGK